MSISYSDTVMFAAIAALAINYMLLRLPQWDQRPVLFWLVQFVNLIAGCWLIAYGIPDLRQDADIGNKMFGLLFCFHIVSNNRRLQQRRRENRNDQRADDDDQRERIRSALRAAEDTQDGSERP